MALYRRPVAILIVLVLSVACIADEDKVVLHTPWWPPGSEKTVEAVGIKSHGFVYTTAMMEFNATVGATVLQESFDIRDILHAGGLELTDLVDCFVNTRSGQAKTIRATFMKVLPQGSNPALTVVEMPGEFPGDRLSNSVICIAALPPKQGAYPRRAWSRNNSFGISAHGLLHVQGTAKTMGATADAESAEALALIDDLIRTAGGSGAEDLVDCVAFVRKIEYASAVRRALEIAVPKDSAPALTIVEAGLEDAQQKVSFKCVAAVPESPGAVVHTTSLQGAGKIAHGKFVYASGQDGTLATNGTDALVNLGQVLSKAGSDLTKVINCLFFMTNNSQVYSVFNGFFDVFNEHNPPPPTRGEYMGALECANCFVSSKCVAAIPTAPDGRHSKLLV